jgi:hypothetical protein
MTDDYARSENGFFFTDIAAPSDPDTSFGDLNPPAPPPFTAPEPGTTTLDDGKVVAYEDDDILMNYFVYDGNGKLVSYLETTKATGIMIKYTFSRSPAAPAEPIGTNEDYQNFAFSGQVDLISDDVSNADIENYDVTETLIASIGPGGILIPA